MRKRKLILIALTLLAVYVVSFFLVLRRTQLSTITSNGEMRNRPVPRTLESGGPADGETLVFHYDGHGSTRVLTDLAGSIATATAPQIFHFTAYGEAINFTMSEAATSYLYSGEQFDSRIGQQYLRARYYDASTGTFNRLDPFFGNQTDPQSFHKYLYTHGDPVNGIDPTGLFMGLTGMLSGMGVQSNMRGTNQAATAGTYVNATSRVRQVAHLYQKGLRVFYNSQSKYQKYQDVMELINLLNFDPRSLRAVVGSTWTDSNRRKNRRP